ncbi:MAG: hypothetical protein HDR26_03805 [Lachnospiraceae bacterium]|nr:hypothetical protein [Lachnospiraceae bacterium]
MVLIDDDFVSNEEKKSEFGVKQYSCQDILFCMMRILFGIYFTHAYNLWLPLIILAVLFICTIVSLSVIIISSNIVAKYVHDYDKHEIAIQRINILNKPTAIYTVVLPHILQFILSFYVAALFCIYASKTEYSTLMWIIGLFVGIITMILIISVMDIFTNEGFTISLSKNISFDTQKNYWGEGLIIIFWSLLYLMCGIYCSYIFIGTILDDHIDIAIGAGAIIFIASIIQTIKCLNLPDIYKTVFGNIKFYDYITYETAMLNCRKLYLNRETMKILALCISITSLVASASFVAVLLKNINSFSVDTITTVICIVAISLTISIFIIRRMCIVPLLRGLFQEEYPEYYSEYLDVSDNNKTMLYLNSKKDNKKS